MVNTPEPFDIQRYFKIGYRRKWYIIIPFILSFVVSICVYEYLPKVYRATVVILIQSPKVPQSYVQPSLTESTTERVNAISQEILTRNVLERVIQEFNLYSYTGDKSHLEGLVDMLRTKIEIKPEPKQSAFSISFQGTVPETVMKVTNRLASMFIEENLKFREQRAGGTVDFISKELQAAESNIKKEEEAVRRLKERYIGQLPEQLGTNLTILERLQQQFKTTSDNLSASEERIILLQNQIEQLMDRPIRGLTRSENIRTEQGSRESSAAQLNALKQELANTELKYTESHPDVVNLKRKIAALELRVKKEEGERKKREGEKERRRRELSESQEEMFEGSPSLNPEAEKLLTEYQAQLKRTRKEAKRLQEEMGSLKEQIALYQRRIEETPKREQEMTQLNREYDRLRNYYQSLMDKKYQSQLAENLELKRQGEQFKIFDSARFPRKPFKPDFAKVLAMGAFLGLAVGLGSAWFRESMDRSFYEASEVETYLKLPVLTSILNLNEEAKKAA